MSTPGDILIRNVEVGAMKGLDILVRDGVIVEIGDITHIPVEQLDGHGGALLPGLHDHHIHLLALASERSSIHVGPDSTPGAAAFAEKLRAASRAAPGKFLRATQYHESVAGPLDRDVLDQLVPLSPLRVQYRTGSLWVLNSAALERVLPANGWPDCVERDSAGRPTGRIWRGDAWLKARLNAPPPDLASVGKELARMGITGVTDTSVTTGAAEADIFSAAVTAGSLPQRLVLMSGEALPSSPDKAYSIGPVKILLDEHALGDLVPMLDKIAQARQWGRNVAVHCVTAAELAFTLAAFDEAGARLGDRIEHGGVIDDEALHVIHRMGLAVVTQPAFIAERGDIYMEEVDENDQAFLYRCGSLIAQGIPVAASSDAPYTNPDPWHAIVAAIERRTKSGKLLGAAERISSQMALNLFLRKADNLSASREIHVGEAADFCLLHSPLREALKKPDKAHVAATIVAGHVIYRA